MKRRERSVLGVIVLLSPTLLLLCNSRATAQNVSQTKPPSGPFKPGIYLGDSTCTVTSAIPSLPTETRVVTFASQLRVGPDGVPCLGNTGDQEPQIGEDAEVPFSGHKLHMLITGVEIGDTSVTIGLDLWIDHVSMGRLNGKGLMIYTVTGNDSMSQENVMRYVKEYRGDFVDLIYDCKTPLQLSAHFVQGDAPLACRMLSDNELAQGTDVLAKNRDEYEPHRDQLVEVILAVWGCSASAPECINKYQCAWALVQQAYVAHDREMEASEEGRESVEEFNRWVKKLTPIVAVILFSSIYAFKSSKKKMNGRKPS